MIHENLRMFLDTSVVLAACLFYEGWTVFPNIEKSSIILKDIPHYT